MYYCPYFVLSVEKLKNHKRNLTIKDYILSNIKKYDFFNFINLIFWNILGISIFHQNILTL